MRGLKLKSLLSRAYLSCPLLPQAACVRRVRRDLAVMTLAAKAVRAVAKFRKTLAEKVAFVGE